MCAVICRQVTLTLPDANFLFARAQNCHFCALFGFGTLVFGHFEHKIGVFVSERATFPGFYPLPSTKLPFLCAFALRNPYFRVFQAQKGLFCVRKGNFSWVLPPPEHKIGVFVLGLLLSPASGRAIKKRVTSKSPNGLFSYPLLWIGICCRCNWGRNICCCRWNWNICCRCDHCSCGCFRIYKQRQTGNCSCLCCQLFCTCTQWRDPSYS